MNTCVFPLLVGVVIVCDLAYTGWFVWGVVAHDWRWISERSCTTYVGVANSVIASAGIAAAVLATALGSKVLPVWILRRSMLCLVASVVFSVFFILILTRSAEAAIARNAESSAEGRLLYLELSLILTLSAFALGTFLVGMLYLGRIAFHL